MVFLCVLSVSSPPLCAKWLFRTDAEAPLYTLRTSDVSLPSFSLGAALDMLHLVRYTVPQEVRGGRRTQEGSCEILEQRWWN